MKNKRTKQGFTLIELLVVVLIIGILAAVALPQYNIAVAKTRFAKLYNILRTYKNAAAIYVVENGAWPTSFDDLDVTAPEGMEKITVGANNCVQNNEFYCCMMEALGTAQTSGITCGLTNYSLAYEYNYKNASGVQKDMYFCDAKKGNNAANKVCQGFGGGSYEASIVSPTGYKGGYNFYYMPK